MTFTSRKINVTELGFPAMFKNWMGTESAKGRMASDLSLAIAVENKNDVLDIRTKHVDPPTYFPTNSPTEMPSANPTPLMSQLPTLRPSDVKRSPTMSPTIIITMQPSKEVNLTANTLIAAPDKKLPIPLIASVSGGAVLTLMLGFLIFYVRPRYKRERTTATQLKPVKPGLSLDIENVESAIPVDRISDDDSQKSLDNYSSDGVPESLLSNGSLLSYGHSMSSESLFETDETNQLRDEFDAYKNPQLESMRDTVEKSVVNSDGMMSQALTRALMMDDDESSTGSEVEEMWGIGAGGQEGRAMEIEASVLCETNDWLKRKEGASLEERRAFMQDALNKMVASVRHEIIAPEDASRTIHGCAAMLGLQLAEKIPMTALIVTGMRKKAQKENVIEAFKAFGDIQDAAVAPKCRGFGLVRYKSPKSVQKALAKFKKEEIVVQDVAVMVRILSSRSTEGNAVRSNPPTPPLRPPASGQHPPLRHSGGGGGAMAAHNSSLDTLGFTEGSLGASNNRMRRDASRERGMAGSETEGSSVASRHSRDQSAASSVEGRRRRKDG